MPKQINKIVLPALLILVVVFFLKRQNAPDSEALANAFKDTITLIDVRSEGEFQSGSLEGAINIPLDELQNHVAELKNKPKIVVFCQSGGRSAQAAQLLESQGVVS